MRLIDECAVPEQRGRDATKRGLSSDERASETVFGQPPSTRVSRLSRIG